MTIETLLVLISFCLGLLAGIMAIILMTASIKWLDSLKGKDNNDKI